MSHSWALQEDCVFLCLYRQYKNDAFRGLKCRKDQPVSELPGFKA